MIVGIDLSLRSTGIVHIDENENLIDFKIIKSKPNSLKANKNKPWLELNEEYLLMYNSIEVCDFVEKAIGTHVLDGVVLEGLSFGSKSGSSDLIAANSWIVTVDLRRKYPNIPIGRISVLEWRNSLTDKEERKLAKEKYGKKAVKQMVVDRLPLDVKKKFEEYITDNKMGKEGVFDLSDAYFLGVYRLGLI